MTSNWNSFVKFGTWLTATKCKHINANSCTATNAEDVSVEYLRNIVRAYSNTPAWAMSAWLAGFSATNANLSDSSRTCKA